MPPLDPARRASSAAALAAADAMRRLDTGPMAELRRMLPDNPAAAFWRIAVQHKVMTDHPDDWVWILRILALLTPKGEAPAGGRARIHTYNRPFGEVLCDGGDPAWIPQSTTADGVVSERRLMLLLATRGEARRVALERAARMIARSMVPGSGIDVTQIAQALLTPENTAPLAEAYFRRLDRATRTPVEEKSK